MLQVSQQYTLRMMKDESLVVPISKDIVTDDIFTKVIMVSGRHQRMLDLSRCDLITSGLFSKLSLCRGLRYLDVSYTKFANIACVAENCLVLQSLFLAGLQLPSYNALSQLTTLQLLNLNFSNIKDLSPLTPLCRLRSLDLGNTPVTCLTSLITCTRLEELILDATGIPVSKANLESLSALKSMKLLNIAATALISCIEELTSCIPKDVHIDLSARRNKWFEAIIDNDLKAVNSLLLQGFDVELRAGPWTSKVLLEAWHGPRYKSQGLFFDCTCQDESQRPMGYHFALLFNSKEVLAALVAAKKPAESIPVWFGPVTGGVLALAPNPSKITNNLKVLFNATEFLKVLIDRRVHVVIENLRETNPGGWVAQAGIIVRTLRSILDDHSFLEKQQEAKQPMDEKALVLRRNQSAPDLVLAAKAEGDEAPVPVHIADRRLKTEALQFGVKASQLWREHPMVARLVKPVLLPVPVKSGVSVASRASAANGGSSLQPELSKSISVPALARPKHAKLSEHHAKTAPKDSGRRTMLGPLSFWLESKAEALREKANATLVNENHEATSHSPPGKNDFFRFVEVKTDVEEVEAEGPDDQLNRTNNTLLKRKDTFLDLLQTRAEIARTSQGNHYGRHSSQSR